MRGGMMVLLTFIISALTLNDEFAYEAKDVEIWLKYTTNANGMWQTESIYQNPDWMHAGITSIALDQGNKAHIAYSFYNELGYITNAQGDWSIEILSNVMSFGNEPSIVLDSSGYAYILAFKYQDESIYYLTNSGGSWNTVWIDGVGDYTSFAIDIDSNDKLHISYYAESLKYTTNAQSYWQTFLLDSGGYPNSVAVDSQGYVHIAYLNPTQEKLLYMTNRSGMWQKFVIDSSDYYCKEVSIAVDSNNKAHIAYLDAGPDYVIKYATNSSGNWEIFDIDTVPDYPSEVSSLIAVDSNDNVYIFYNDSIYNPDEMRYEIFLKYALKGASEWQFYELKYDAYYYSPSVALDQFDKIHIAYFTSYSAGDDDDDDYDDDDDHDGDVDIDVDDEEETSDKSEGCGRIRL